MKHISRGTSIRFSIRWRTIIRIFILCFGLSILLQTPSFANSAPYLQVNSLPANTMNIKIDNVLDAFNALDDHGVKLAAYVNGGYRVNGGLIHGLYNKPTNDFSAGPLKEGQDHFQGIMRLKDNYFVVSGAGIGNNPVGSHLFFIRLDTKSDAQYSEAPLRSNLLSYSTPVGEVPTEPQHGDGVYDWVYRIIVVDTNYYHAGGMSLSGDILAVPLENGDSSKIVFYDVSDPITPQKLNYEVRRDDYNFNIDLDLLTNPPGPPGNILDGDPATATRKGGAVLLTQRDDGRFLLGVWSDADKLDIDNYSEGVNVYGIDGIGDYYWALDLYVSVTPHMLDFDDEKYTKLCFGNTNGILPDSGATHCDAIMNINFPEGHNRSTFQTLHFVEESSGKLFIIGTYNDGIYQTPVTNFTGAGNGTNKAMLYDFSYHLNSIGDEVEPSSVTINLVAEKEMHCEVEDYTDAPLSDSYCNFQAGTGLFVQNPEEFTLYAVDHYLRNSHQEPLEDPFEEDEGTEIRFQEFRPILNAGKVITNINEASIEIYEHALHDTRFTKGTSWMIDYQDHPYADYQNYNNIHGIADFNFFEKVSAIRAMIPTGYTYLFFEHSTYEINSGIRQPQGECLAILGNDNLRTFADLSNTTGGDWHHREEPETIAKYGNACRNVSGFNDKITTSGYLIPDNNFSQYNQDGFFHASIEDPNDAWIIMYEDENFNGDASNLGLLGILTTGTETILNDYTHIVGQNGPSNFDDKINSVRYQIPIGYTYRLYKNSNFDKSAGYFDLIGTSKIEEFANLGDYNIGGAISSSKYITDSGLLAYWNFEGYEQTNINGNESLKFADYSGNNNHLYDWKSTNSSQDTSITFSPKFAHAAQFNSDSLLWAGSNGTIPTDLNEFTFSFWIGTTEAEAGEIILEMGNSLPNPNIGFFSQIRLALTSECNDGHGETTFGIVHNWQWEAQPSGTTGTELVACGNEYLDVGHWHQVSITYAGGFRRIYLDGELVSTDISQTGPIQLVEPLSFFLLGGHIPTANALEGVSDFSGLLDEVRIYDKALPEDVIESNLCGCEESLVLLSPKGGVAQLTNVASVMLQIDSWDSGGGWDFDLYLGTSPDNMILYDINQSGGTFYLFEDVLENDTTYYGRIISKNFLGHFAVGEIFSFTTDPNNAPTPPSGPTPTNGAIDQPLSITLAWDEVEDIDLDIVLYDIYLGDTPNSLTLISSEQVENTFSTFLTDNTTYYWQVVAKDTKGGVVALSTPGPIWSFTTRTNQSPIAPTNLLPADGAGNQPFHNLMLNWDLAIDPDNDMVFYDIYIGKSASELLSTSNVLTNHVTLDLEPNTTYYWQVVAKDFFGGEGASVTQNFTTRGNQAPLSPDNPIPPHGSVDQYYDNLILNWQGSDPDGDDLLYDVYVGDSPTTLELFYYNVEDPQHEINLQPETTYYWQVVAKDGLFAGQAESAVWSFTTTQAQEGPPDHGVTNDADTSLLLYFNQLPHPFIGADGEMPLSTGQVTIYIEDGLFGEAAFFPSTVNELNYYSQDNIDEQVGTLEFWIQPEWNGDDNLDHTVLRYGYWGGMIFSKDASNNLRGVWNRFANGGQPEVNVEADISDWVAGEWHHVAYTWDENNVQLYIDGVLRDETAVTTPLPLISDTTFQIGGDGTISYLGAKLDDLRISSRVRTTAEINAVYLFGSQYLNQDNMPPEPATNPTPADGATDQLVDATLGWDVALDPDGGPVTYDVYLGLDPNDLQLVASAQITETLDPDDFSYETTYYWRVDVRDDHGHVTIGNVWSFTTEALPANILPPGYYEEADPRFTYNGSSPWLYWQGATASRNSIFYTYEPGASVTFQIYGSGLTIYRYIQWNAGDMEVCIDGECTVVNNYHPTASYPRSPVSFTGLEFGVHTVEIENVSTSAAITIDAIKVLDPQPLGTGMHENNNPNIVYSGRWIEWVEYTLLSQGTAHYVAQSGAIVEFQIDGDEMIIYRSKYSGWGNMLVCIDDNPCSTVSNNSATALYRQPVAFSNLGSGIHDVVIQTTSAGTVDIDAIEVNKTAAPIQTGLHQETSQQITKTGNWLSYNSGNTNGGTEIYTYDQTAELSFSVEGEQFVLYRLVGPNLDASEICIDTVCANHGNFNPTHTYKQPLVFDDLGPGVHDIIIRKANVQPNDYIAVDAILIPEPLTIGLHQENDVNFIYGGNWSNWTYTNYVEAEKYTADNAAYVEFSFIGDGVAIYRPTNADRTMTTVCVDNATCKTGNGYSSSAVWDVPISFTNLGMGLHTARVYPTTSSPFDSVSIDFDAVEILGPLTPLTPGQTYNPEENPYFVHHGDWQEGQSAYTVGGDWFYNNVLDTEINFRIDGDELILYVTKANWAGIIQVCVDGNRQTFDLYSSTAQYQVPLSLPNLGAGVHEVKISNASYPIFTPRLWVDIEAVEVLSNN